MFPHPEHPFTRLESVLASFPRAFIPWDSLRLLHKSKLLNAVC